MSRNCGCTGVELSGTPTSNAEVERLLKEVNTLLKSTEATILCQNGKIDETMVYIKNNLSLALQSLLDSMESSGEIDTIILNAITNYGNKLDEMTEYFDSKTLSLDFNRIFRHVAESMGNRGVSDVRNNKIAFGQGITQTDETVIFGECCNYNYNNNGHFVEFNKSTNEIVREWDLTDVGHVSAIAYNCSTNEFYVLPFWYNSNGTSIRTNDLKIYNYNTMSLKKTVSLDVNIAGITVDNTGKIYGCTGDTVYRIYSNFTMSVLFSYESIGGIQGMAVFEDNIYLNLFNATYLLKTDMSGNVIANIPIERYYGIYFTGEPEGITVDSDGNLYMLSCSYNPYSYYFCNQVFYTNVKTNTPVKETRSGNCQSLSNFYVGNPTSNNPDGTSANPFGTICELLLSFNSPLAKSVGLARVDLQKDCPEETFYYRGGDVVIMGNNKKIAQLWLSDCNVYLNALAVENPSDGLMTHNIYMARCRGTIYSVTSIQNYGVCNINLDFCQIRIMSATCQGTPTEGRVKANGGEVMGNSKATNEMIYGTGQILQKTTTLFSSATPFEITKEQIYQLSNVFTNLQIFAQLSEGNVLYAGGCNAKLTGPDMEAIEGGSMSKAITCEFMTSNGLYVIGCNLKFANSQFTLGNFKSYLFNGSSVTEGTKEFTVLAMTMN